MYTIKPLEELDVIDDFLMNAIANDENVSEDFFRTLLSSDKQSFLIQQSPPINNAISWGKLNGFNWSLFMILARSILGKKSFKSMLNM